MQTARRDLPAGNPNALRQRHSRGESIRSARPPRPIPSVAAASSRYAECSVRQTSTSMGAPKRCPWWAADRRRDGGGRRRGRKIFNLLRVIRIPEPGHPLPTAVHLIPIPRHPRHLRRSGTPASANPDVTFAVCIPRPVSRHPDELVACRACLPAGFPRCWPAAGSVPPGPPRTQS